MSTLDTSYGYVTGRFLYSVGDTSSDSDSYPDATPAAGTIILEPLASHKVIPGSSPASFVLPRPITLTLDSNGVILDPSSSQGVWVMTGAWRVRFNFQGVTVPSYTVTVTADHTEESPLDLALAAPMPTDPTVRWVVNEEIMSTTLAARDEATTAASTAQSAATSASQSAAHAETSAAQAATSASSAAESAQVAQAATFAGSDLGTADLDAITTPGIYYQRTTANATLEKHYPLTNGCGVLEVFSMGAINNGRMVQRFTVQSGVSGAIMRGIYQRRMWDGAWQDWFFIPSQRVDQTAGRAIYTWDDVNNREQLIWGDTGWRDVTSLLSPNYTLAGANSKVRLRRRGGDVELQMPGMFQREFSGPGDVLTLPAAYAPSGSWTGWQWGTRGSTPNARFYVANSGGNTVVRAATQFVETYESAVYMRATWTTDAPWPTTLPGVAL